MGCCFFGAMQLLLLLSFVACASAVSSGIRFCYGAELLWAGSSFCCLGGVLGVLLAACSSVGYYLLGGCFLGASSWLREVLVGLFLGGWAVFERAGCSVLWC